MLSLLAVYFIAVLEAMTQGSSARDMELRNAVDAAWSEARAGRIDAARASLAGLYEQHADARAAGYLADLHLERGDTAGALRCHELCNGSVDAALADRVGLELARAVEERREPTPAGDWPAARSARDHDSLARLFLAREELERAIAAADEAVRSDPTCFLWRKHRAGNLAELKRYPDAAADLRVLRVARRAAPGLIRDLAIALQNYYVRLHRQVEAPPTAEPGGNAAIRFHGQPGYRTRPDYAVLWIGPVLLPGRVVVEKSGTLALDLSRSLQMPGIWVATTMNMLVPVPSSVPEGTTLQGQALFLPNPSVSGGRGAMSKLLQTLIVRIK